MTEKVLASIHPGLKLIMEQLNYLEQLLKSTVMNLQTNHWFDSNHPIRYFPAQVGSITISNNQKLNH